MSVSRAPRRAFALVSAHVRGVLWMLVNRSLLAGLALVALIAVPAIPRADEVEISADPAVTRGPASAPVTIVEFSDYQ